ncbi:MAG: hypothetical protein FWG10_11185 [Eubacteriaceae bacterium]|nr:hypothetical protein [Eubacteriaceae bacterium]
MDEYYNGFNRSQLEETLARLEHAKRQQSVLLECINELRSRIESISNNNIQHQNTAIDLSAAVDSSRKLLKEQESTLQLLALERARLQEMLDKKFSNSGSSK